MSKKSNQLAILAAALMLIGENSLQIKSQSQPKMNLPKSKEEIARQNGLKCFDINGVKIWAINENNAIKKYNKQTR